MLVKTLASWILPVVVLCDHFRHIRDHSWLHTPLIDVPWLFPSSQDERSVLTRRLGGHFSPSAPRHASPLGTWMISSLHVSLAAKLAVLGHSEQTLGKLLVKLSLQGVHFIQLLLALVCACSHLRPRVGPSAHFAVPGSTPSSSVAERHARH